MSSYKIIILSIILLGVGIVAWQFSFTSEDQPLVAVTGESEPAVVDVVHEASGFGFSYPKGTGGYVLETSSGGDLIDDQSFVTGYELSAAAEAAALADAPDVPREGPPTIQIMIYANAEGLSPAAWVATNPEASNIALALSEPTEAVVSGEAAVRYQIDGLYRSDVVVMARGEYVVLLTGAYLDAESEIRNDFQELVESVEFKAME